MMYDELGDPAQQAELQNQQQDLLRQIAMATALRKQADAQNMTPQEGQMVSGHYVAPHWTQQLASVINPLMAQSRAQQAEEAAAQKRTVLAQAVAQAQQKWMNEQPQGTPGAPAIPAVQAVPGAPIERGGQTNPEATGTQGAPAIPPAMPDQGAVLRHTLAGMRIPGNEKIAETYGKGMEGMLKREDDQAFRREEAEKNRLAQLATHLGKMQEARDRLEEIKRSNLVNEAERQRAHQAAEALSAQMLEIKKELADAKVNAGKQPERKPIPSTLANAYVNNLRSDKQLDEALTKVEKTPEAFGIKNLPAKLLTKVTGEPSIATALGYNREPDKIAVRALIADIGSLKIHDRSGATVTVSETPRLVPFIPTETDTAVQVTQKLKGLKEAIKQHQQSIEDFAAMQGYKSPGGDTPTIQEK